MPDNISRRNVIKLGGAAAAIGVFADFMPQAAARAATVGASPASASALGVSRQLAAAFANPTAQQKAMTRTWFPDAGLGGSAAGLQFIADHFKAMAAAGFGGAEIAMPSDGTKYTNADAQTIGFGSPNWKNIVRQVLTTANSIPGGFGIDLTLSSHWPVAVDIIDPNDDGQQQQVTTAYAKITAADLASGTVSLPLPAQRTTDSVAIASNQTSFVFVNKFVAAAVVKVASIASGNPVFTLVSLADASGQTSQVKNPDGSRAGNAAGVPDAAWAATNGVDYATLLAQWGPEPSNPNFPGKIDAAGDRKRMADWQYLYQTDLTKVAALSGYTPSAGSALAVGDYVLYGIYRQGTGQVMSGGGAITQYNRSYVVDIYDSKGVAAISDFWHEKILDDEMIALLRENARSHPADSVFEDSFEVSHTGAFWPASFLPTASQVNGDNATAYALVYALNSASLFDDTATATRILEDYVLTLNYLYEQDHIGGIEKFAAEFGYKFKNQSEAGSTGIAGAEPSLGVVEGDNGSGDEGFRTMAGAVNLAGTTVLSDEALTFVASSYSTVWATLDAALNEYWATGVNRVNLHGTPFPVTFNNWDDAWPGWNFLGLGVFEPRQVWWTDITQFSGYMARNQSVMQAGVAKVDLAVLEGSDARFSLPGSNSLPAALNLGYSYNVIDETMFDLPMAKVSGGVLAAQGPAYRAIVVNQATRLSVAGLKTLIGYAQAGLPVVLYNCAVTRVFGTNKAANNDTDMAKQLAILQGLPGVYQAATEASVLSYLASRGIAPAASYSAANTLVAARQDGDTNYYFLYSEGTTLSASATAGDTGIQVASTAGLVAGQQLIIDTSAIRETVTIASVPSPAPSSGANVLLTAPLAHAHIGGAASSNPFGGGGAVGVGVSTVVDTTVTLRGAGAPYQLNAWTGEVTPVPAYTSGKNGVTLRLTLLAGESTIIALKAGGSDYLHAVGFGAGRVGYTADGTLTLRASKAGTYSVALSTGSSQKVTVGALPSVPSLSSGWNLSLESWGPDANADATDPRASAKTTVTFAGISLGDWAALPATAAQLTTLGVTSMSQVSGIGTYGTSFILPASWTAADGAYLQLAHNVLYDIVTGVAINGHALPPGNQFTDSFDLGGYLKAGTNTLTVRLDTDFNNRVVAAGGEDGGFGFGGNGGGGSSVPNGLTGAQLIPYVATPISAQ